jgi:hypothetical protein
MDQTDVVIGTVRVTVSKGGLIVGLSQGEDHIALSRDEVRAIAGLVVKLEPPPGEPDADASKVSPPMAPVVTPTSKLADPTEGAGLE